MNTLYEPSDHSIVAQTRESFSARLLTDPQFEEFAAICAILNREIHKSASFIEKLETYAFAVSRTEKGINAAKADTIIRDLFKGLFGQSMDQLRKALLKAEDELNADQLTLGLDFAYAVLQQVEDGDKIPFYRAYAHQAALMATELGISDVFAKRLMSEQFETAEDRAFYEEGKQFEDKYYRPKIEAEKRKRAGKSGSHRKRYGGYAGGQSGGNPGLAESMGLGHSNASSDAKPGDPAQPTPSNT